MDSRAWRRIAAGLTCTLLAPWASDAQADDLQFWQEGDVQLLQGESLRAGLGWKVVVAEQGTIPRGWELKPNVQRRLSHGLDVAATYKFSRGRAATNAWSTLHALELDLAPSWPLGENGARAHFTQKLGLVRLFATEPAGYRYHLIPRVAWPAAWLPGQTAAESGFEAIYDLGNSSWIETKLTPLRLQFSAGAAGAWSVSYLLNDRRGAPAARWQRSHVLVATLAFNAARRSRPESTLYPQVEHAPSPPPRW